MFQKQEGASYLLTVNGGSSSLKLSVFQFGNDQAVLRLESALGAQDSAVDELLTQLFSQVPAEQITAVGHRIVHGGANYSQPVVIDDDVIYNLQSLTAFDPDHLPFELEIIQKLKARLPNAKQVACFDTTFHHDMPLVAQALAIPRKYQQAGLRRYGFHGLSYEYLLSEVIKTEGQAAADGRIVFAHLGSGSSLAATKNAKPVDTTMGFSPGSGVMMSTRSGDLDPGALYYLQKTQNLTAEQVNIMVNKQSGLLGVSETTGDMKTLLAARQSDPRAQAAIDLYCYQIRKTIGAYTAALGGLDMLVFSGGIGQNSAEIRQMICRGLEFLGINLDNPEAKVKVKVIASDEEQIIAKQTQTLLGNPS